MRRGVAVLVGLLIVPTAAAGTAAGPRPQQRHETVSYARLARRVTIDPGVVTGHPGVSVTSVKVDVEEGERALSLKATDDSGHPVRISVDQDGHTITWFCNESPGPLPVRPGVVTIEVFSGVCGNSAGLATTGTLELTYFRRLPEKS